MLESSLRLICNPQKRYSDMNQDKNQIKKPIKQALKELYSSKSLTSEQLGRLQLLSPQNSIELEQKPAEVDSHHAIEPSIFSRSKYFWLSSMAASVMIFFILFDNPHPGLITSAYQDIAKDSELHNGLDIAVSDWLAVKNISPVPEEFDIEMSKFCQLERQTATHIRVAGKSQGTAHFFFHQTDTDLQPEIAQGVENELNWKIIYIRENISVLVMYTQDMREEAIQKILHGMLPDMIA